MRIGLLADVHANLPALETALRWLEAQDVERIVCAGDLVGYGAEPDACVARLVACDAICVAGNHDWLLLGRLAPDRFSGAARAAAAATRPHLGADTRTYLADLPLVRTVGPLVAAHGTLDDPEAYVEDRAAARDQLLEARRRFPGSTTLVLGNTHHPMHVRVRTRHADPGQVVNPGAVGQSRAREAVPHCRLAVLDTTSGRVSFARLAYDHDAAHTAVRRLELPDTCVHSRPTRRSAVLRHVPSPARRQLRRLRARYAA